MRRHAAALIAALLPLVASCGSAVLDDPLAPVPTRVDPEDIPPPMIRPLWKVGADIDADGENDAPSHAPALGPTAAFIAYDKLLHAREIVRGELLWTARFATPLVHAPLARATGGVAVLTERRLVWLGDDGAAIAAVPVAAATRALTLGNQVVVAGPEGVTSWLLRNDEIRRQWALSIAGVVALRHAPAPDLLLLTTAAGVLHAIDRAGATRWQHDQPPLQPLAPAVAGDRLYVVRADTRVASLDASTGSRGWASRPMGVASGGAPAARDRVVWVPALDGALHGFSTGGGSDLHRVRLAGRTRVDLVPWQRWIIASPEYGPLTLVHGPMSRLGPGDPGQPRIEIVAVDGDLEHDPAVSAHGILVVDAAGGIRLLAPYAGPPVEADDNADDERQRPTGSGRDEADRGGGR